MRDQQTLRILILQGEDCVVAQCLEYDVCTQAPDEDTLRARMDCLLNIEIKASEESGQPLDQAPAEFHKMWDDLQSTQCGNHWYAKAA